MNSLLDSVIEDDNMIDEKVFGIEKEILESDKPNIWNVHRKGNMERAIEVDFQKFALAVTEESPLRLEDTMTFTFYANVERLKEKYKKK